jgi:hypothetical protein
MDRRLGVMASTNVAPVQAGNVVVSLPTYEVTKFVPVAARVYGPGTSSAIPSGAAGIDIPEAAILVTPQEAETSL